MEIKNIDELKALVNDILNKEINVNGADNMKRVWFFIGQGKKINAIKAYRDDVEKLPLREAKALIERMIRQTDNFIN